MRRATLSRALVLVLALGAAITAPFHAAAAAGCPGGCVEVYLPDGGSPVSFTVAQITALADVHNASYTTRIQGGTTFEDTPHVTAGLSISALITDASPGINLHTVTFTAVPRPNNGTWSTLTTPDLLPGSDFEDGLLPCVFSDGSQLHYVRPLRDSDDTNGNDSFQAAAGANLEVHVFAGPQLSVSATASSTNVKVGKSVDFGSSVSGAGTGATITYSWTINNGSATVPMEPSTSNPSHTFSTAGEYEVLLTANGSDGSAGLANPIYVRVGSAPINSGTPTPGPSKSPNPHPSQSASGTPTPTASPSAPAGSPSTGGSGTTPAGATGSKAGSTSDSAAASAPAQRTSSPSPTAADSAEDLPVVQGRLIGQTAALKISSGVVVDDSAAGSAADPLSQGWRAPAAVGWIAAIMLLFAAGAVRERRRTRRLRSVVSPR
jgi:PKD repeat protein